MTGPARRAKKLRRNNLLSVQNLEQLISISIFREEPEVEEKPKKNRSEAIDRWGHDMFDPNQQGPKSDQELVDLYGYDIRQEEGAPR